MVSFLVKDNRKIRTILYGKQGMYLLLFSRDE